jgi:hypothetical protein
VAMSTVSAVCVGMVEVVTRDRAGVRVDGLFLQGNHLVSETFGTDACRSRP